MTLVTDGRARQSVEQRLSPRRKLLPGGDRQVGTEQGSRLSPYRVPQVVGEGVDGDERRYSHCHGSRQ